jgi:hypothetical protein
MCCSNFKVSRANCMEAIVAALPEYFFVVMRIHEILEICQAFKYCLSTMRLRLLMFLGQAHNPPNGYI